jgi:hypothetical protein
VKGITLTFENSKAVNFTVLKKMILDDDTPVHANNPLKIKTKFGGLVLSEPETKEEPAH